MWIILILVVPVVGVAFYIFTRVQPGTAYISHRVNALIEEEKDYLTPHKDTLYDVYAESKQECGFMQYLYKRGKYPVYSNASVKYFPLGEDKFQELLYQLAREGVEVRFMYDGTCTLSLLPRNYPKRLEQLGIQCKIFAPMRPFLSTHQNNRDHRKIAVIDGRAAFTGGVNLADEYINRKERFGHWKDTAVMVQGEAVNSFTLMFLQLWNINVKEKEDYSKYMQYTSVIDRGMRNGGYVVPYGDSPYDDEDVGEKVYLDILNRSQDYVHILPHIPDKKYAYLLARTYYQQLISNGVEIYEYTPGFVHAKVFTCDDERAVVGTINLDYRSLYLHFECAAYIWKNPVINDIELDFFHTLEKCQRIDLENCKKYNPIAKLAGQILRLIAPLM